MSKYIRVIPVNMIERIAIINGNGLSLAKIKNDADFILNGGFYDMTTGKPAGHLKANGAILGKEPWSIWGYKWRDGADIAMDVLPCSTSNYINGVELLTPHRSIRDKLEYLREVGGIRGRSAIALTKDALILYCSGDGTSDGKTPEALRDELHNLDAVSAIMLDGGGSAQCDFQGQKISSSRRVHNYIAVWLKKSNQKPTEEDKPMDQKHIVCIDAGHGVETAGKCAPDKSYYEHEFNLDISNRQKAILERHGIKVFMTRNDQHDISLEQRVKIANGIGGLDLFISNHSNASGSGVDWANPDGYGVYTSAAGVTANRNILANKLIAKAKAAGVKLWGNGLFHEAWYVCKNTFAPAVLVEHGFHTNKAETALLKTEAYRQKLAEADCKGILDYLGVMWQDKPVEVPVAPETPAGKPWYADDQSWAIDSGVSDGTRPESIATRAEVWAMLHRVVKMK